MATVPLSQSICPSLLIFPRFFRYFFLSFPAFLSSFPPFLLSSFLSSFLPFFLLLFLLQLLALLKEDHPEGRATYRSLCRCENKLLVTTGCTIATAPTTMEQTKDMCDVCSPLQCQHMYEKQQYDDVWGLRVLHLFGEPQKGTP